MGLPAYTRTILVAIAHTAIHANREALLIDWNQVNDFERQNAERICRYFFPDGKKEGQEWKIDDVNGGKGRSLGIHLSGEKAALWYDHATGEGGRLRKLIAQN